MPLSKREHDEITEQFWRDIAHYLNKFTWQWVLTLTIADFPGKNRPRASAKRLVNELYPRFIRGIEKDLQVPVQDYWAAERGKLTGRTNIHVLLTVASPTTDSFLKKVWRQVSSSDAKVEEYRPDDGPYYFIKDVVRSEADIIEYGGSVIRRRKIPALLPKPKFRKSHHRQSAGLTSTVFRPQPGNFRDQSQLRDQSSAFRLPSRTLDRLRHARRIREMQGVA